MASGYAIDGMFLALYAWAGTQHWSVAALYLLLGWLWCAGVTAWIYAGRSLHLKDPALFKLQATVSTALSIAGIALFPEVALVFALALFFVFLLAAYGLDRRNIMLGWLAASVVGGLAVLGDARLQIPVDTPAERLISWLCFVVALGRCVLLGLNHIALDMKLTQRRKQMAQALKQIERLASHDDLTGTLNRRRLMQVLEEELARCRRIQAPFSVALLDIDRFKSINDTFGHLAGDKALVHFVQEVQRLARLTDRFGRYGGEEFLLVMPDSEAQASWQAIERLRIAMRNTDWSSAASDMKLTFSAGVASWQEGETVAQLLSRADAALYAAKKDGRDCTHAAGLGNLPALRAAMPAHSLNQASVVLPEADRKPRRTLDGVVLSVLAMIATSYSVDGLFLLLFHWAGTVSWTAAATYTASGLLLCMMFTLLVVSGRNARFKDKTLASGQAIASAALQLACIALWPGMGFMFMLVLFIVFTLATTRLQLRLAVAAWVVIGLGIGAVISLGGAPVQLPHATLTERILVWVFYAVTLGRCAFMGTYYGGFRFLLRKHGAELAQLTKKVEDLARHDELTGLLNRRNVMDSLEEEQRRAARTERPLSVALLDLDFFKRVNDTLGHQAGDTALREFAETVQKLVRGTDRIGRYGGEEFLLVLVDTDAKEAGRSIDRLRAALAVHDWSVIAPGYVQRFSAGIAQQRDDESAESLLQRADEALYRAKNDGRDCSRLG